MPTAIPESLDALLTRDHTSEALSEAGYPVRAKTLSTKATRGGGQPFRKFGSRCLYRWADALHWAEAQLSPLRGSTSEGATASPVAPTPAEAELRPLRAAVAAAREEVARIAAATRR
jgi:hypothetical protein